MNPTYDLIRLDGTLSLHDEGEWSGTKTRYLAFNDAGVECEVGELLYSMVRILKPARVLETGTHYGIGSCYMALALKENGYGKLDTCEFLKEIYLNAADRFMRVGLNDWIDLRLVDARDFVATEKYKLILLDTEPQTRFAELEKFYPNLEDGGFVFIHDLHNHMHQIENKEHGFAWPFGKVTEFMGRKVKDGELRPFHFPTPRGLTGFYKVSPKDYEWR